MKKKINKPNGKHMREEDRAFIAEALQGGLTFKEIGKSLLKDPTTIAKEVKMNRVSKSASPFNNGGINYSIVSLAFFLA